MNKQHCMFVLALGLSLGMVLPVAAQSAASSGQTAAASAPAEAGTAPAQAAALGDWWDRSSLSYATMPDQFLFHGLGNLHFMDAQGNTRGTVAGGGVQLFFRKHRVTDFASETIERNSITYAFNSGSAHFEENTFLNQTDFDLTRTLMLVGGVQHYRNTMIFMDKRLTEYAGLGYTPYSAEKFGVNFVAAGGYSSFRFDGTGIDQVQPNLAATLPTLTPGSGGVMIADTLHWQALPSLQIGENATYMKYGRAILGHRWEIGVNAMVPITRRFSLTPGYNVKDEANVYTTALHLKPQDRTFTLGLAVSF